MRLLTFGVLLAIIVIACKKEDERKQLETQEFELGECFSTLSLNNSEVVITDENSYFNFQDSIRRHFNSACDTVSLPYINFTESFFIGKYTQTSGCDVEYIRTVYYNEKTNEYDYEIKMTPVGDCEMLISSFNCKIVPIQSEAEVVNFIVIQE